MALTAPVKPWSRDHDRCLGYEANGAHHDCASPALPHAANGRCARCYAIQRRAEKPTGDPFPSINDEEVRGPWVASREKGGAMALSTQAPAPPQPAGPLFAVFTGPLTARGGAEPTCSVRADGRLTINAAAVALLGTPSHVELLYAADAALLGVRAASADAPHARMLRDEGKGSRYLAIGGLLAAYGRRGAVVRGARIQRHGDVLAILLPAPSAKAGR